MCTKVGYEGKKGIFEEDEKRTKRIRLQGVTLHEIERAREVRKNLEAYRYGYVTETKRTRIMGTSV